MVRRLLEEAGFDVIGEADDVRGALRLGADLQPDIMLLDVQLPDGTGIEATRTMRTWETSPAIVLISTNDYAESAHLCGADGFIGKADLSLETLRAAVGPT